ncbi:uncharacterized protein EKO05_0004077 [Ascochyta rabiei]|uniref:Uncharacterized protein n=1 Tax=Didymella rabiei TaxID=5454 RepID=A0A162XTJ3_DIDRA|nr:uncharacterized protein EKO05_0004077 [Ascochyta rabiei]KZM19675.1 hypothetical protein ST47_g9239 [Ascochyta rabiei]UPX13574.1 hypothetical protein EKO05_0004077 [Ascochyta rabiei]
MSNPNDLTTREMEVLALAWQCMESEPKVNIQKLAQLTGYTSGSASVTFGKIKRKLKGKAAGVTTSNPATPKRQTNNRGPRSAPKSSPKRGATEEAAAGTPSKKGKMASKLAANDDDDEEFTTFTVKKEEVEDIANGADAFFQEAAAYATADDYQV